MSQGFSRYARVFMHVCGLHRQGWAEVIRDGNPVLCKYCIVPAAIIVQGMAIKKWYAA